MTSRHAQTRKRHDATGRTKGADQQHVRLYEWMMKSPAWQDLSPAERAVYIEAERRYFGRGTNNGRIGLSVRAAAKACKIAKETAGRALHRLEEHGFLKCTTEGGFNRKTRHAAEWRLTREQCDVTGEPATKDFMRWRPPAGKNSEHGPKSGTLRSQTKDTQPKKAA